MALFDFLKGKKKPVKRSYDGAEKRGRFRNRRSPSTSANTEIKRSLKDLRNNSRQLRRNNPYVARAIGALVSNTVGHGIQTQFLHSSPARIKKVESLWKEWAKSTACDFDGRLNFNQIQKIVASSRFESGEVLIRFRYTNDKIPFKLQVLESDFIADHIKKENVYDGIELDNDGRVVKYHLYRAHPGNDTNSFKEATDTIEVDASEIMHVFKTERPGQLRGVPEIAPVMNQLQDLHEFQNAELVKQKTMSCFAGFIHDMNGDAAADNLMDSGEEGELAGERIEPGTLEYLDPGKSITFSNPSTKTGYKEFVNQILHSIAAGIEMSYEVLTNDYSEVNYSSARMGHIQFQKKIKDEQKNVLIPLFVGKVSSKFIELLPTMGVPSNGVTVKHICPAFEMVDVSKEVGAYLEGIRGGIFTLSEVVTSLGKDPDEHFAQIKIDNDRIDKLKLKLDSDPRTTQKNGSLHQQENSLDEKKDKPTT